MGKQALREQMLGHMARKYGLPVAIVNQVGGNDDLIFDGRSAAFDAQGRLFARAKGFEEDVLIGGPAAGTAGPDAIAEDDFDARSRNLERARARRSRLCAQDAVPQGAAGPFRRHRFGADRRHRGRCHGPGKRARRHDAFALFEPGQRGRFRGTGAQSGHPDHARCRSRASWRPTRTCWRTPSAALPPDVTEENIQSRIRGNLLMALSNKFGSLLLTTGQ